LFIPLPVPFFCFPVKQDREKTNRIEKKGQQDNKKPYRTAIKPTGIHKKGTGCRQTLQNSHFRPPGEKPYPQIKNLLKVLRGVRLG